MGPDPRVAKLAAVAWISIIGRCAAFRLTSSLSHKLWSPPSQVHPQRTVLMQSPAVGTDVTTTTKSRTQRIMESLPREDQAEGAGGNPTYEGLMRADAGWKALRNMKTGRDAGPAPVFVKKSDAKLGKKPEFDVAVCGGTLGIFAAVALQRRGFRVCVLERGALRGRKQEWNISRQELEELVEVEILAQSDIDDVIAIEFNPLRAGFKRAEGDPNGVDTFCDDVLNLGVRPNVLVDKARARFEAAGGVIMEKTSLTGVTVHEDGAELQTEGSAVTARLVLDCMGNASPMVRQLRWGIRPDGVCLVVGSCARGFPAETNRAGDIIYCNSPIQDKGNGLGVQYFWEAFPAGSGPTDRTTYMFAYMDADPRRISLQDMMEDYWRLMPEYQGVNLDDLEFQRVLFGSFPTYKQSPLPTAFDRVCQIGDASGAQSPLSFGGFACLTRHVKRLTAALSEALELDMLDQQSLQLVNPYLPSLSSAWMFQKSMSVAVGQKIDENLIVDILANNFKSMDKLGLPILKPFLQDVIQFGPLLRILSGVTVDAPGSVPSIISHVGFRSLAEWTTHFARLAFFSAMHRSVGKVLQASLPRLSKRQQYRTKRLLEQWEYGAGLDYKLNLKKGRG